MNRIQLESGGAAGGGLNPEASLGFGSFLRVEIPNSDGISGAVGRLDFVRIPSIRPEQQQSVKQRLNVDDVRFPFWKDPEDASMRVVPVLVQVVDAGDAASVSVRIVHMFDVSGAVSRVTRHHGR